MACVRKRRGKYVVDWRDGAGVRRWKTFDKKTDISNVAMRAPIAHASTADRWIRVRIVPIVRAKPRRKRKA